jgi:putative DNA methylase
LNPVAVLITKALIEIPPKFAGKPPVNPEARTKMGHGQGWKGAQGLAEDVRYYGRWMRDEACKRIGHLYPKVRLPKEQGGGEATVIAWLWARTVKCPNPACGAITPIAKTLQLSGKRGNEVHAQPLIDRSNRTVRFLVRHGKGEATDGNVTRTGARCLLCQSPISLDHVRDQAMAGYLGQQILGIVAEGHRKRLYLDADESHVEAALGASSAIDAWVPSTDLPAHALGFRVQRYGMTTHASLFSRRQIVALSTFSDLIRNVAAEIAQASGDESYAAAVATYLAFALDKAANYWSSLCAWYVTKEIMVSTFGLPTLSMTWDFAEANPFSGSTGNWMLGVEQAADALDSLPPSTPPGVVAQADAAADVPTPAPPLVVTDPPYYDNIGYAALSDFFYVWLRRSIGPFYVELFSTVLTPKTPELIADSGRFGGDRGKAVGHFERGLFRTFERLRDAADGSFPLSFFYAFKQQERIGSDAEAFASSGWETMLQALVQAGFVVSGTWPVRTEQTGGLREAGRNALASSIVLTCRPRTVDAPITSRRDFLASLKAELPKALRKLQHGNIAPVDLAQAAIGPGMAVFSRYSKVLEADATPMRVRTALALINQALDEVLAEQEGEFDADTRWAVAWFEQHAMDEGQYGIAETLSKAKNTSIKGLEDAGILHSKSGKVRLLKREEFNGKWDPATDKRLTVWEVTQHLIRSLGHDGESGAAALLAKTSGLGDAARDLAYRLYGICERKKWAQEALAYNGLVIAWPEIAKLAAERGIPRTQEELF